MIGEEWLNAEQKSGTCRERCEGWHRLAKEASVLPFSWLRLCDSAGMR